MTLSCNETEKTEFDFEALVDWNRNIYPNSQLGLFHRESICRQSYTHILLQSLVENITTYYLTVQRMDGSLIAGRVTYRRNTLDADER